MNLSELRTEYTLAGLSETDLDPDPFVQFRRWLEQALQANLMEPYAMTLATATPQGAPSARIVLLRGIDEAGFTFFTSYRGRKAQEIELNPQAALVFYWAPLERQVRIEGVLTQVTPEESDDYFAGRPRGSQLGAWASEQSSVLPDRTTLEQALAHVMARFGDENLVPRPPDWGGYRLVPHSIEFWQGRPSRLHDRLRYRRSEDNGTRNNNNAGPWTIERLAP